jgi:NAD(P)-dependent dehydrogenase (short-subunit alcohol dehydrogenase family)
MKDFSGKIAVVTGGGAGMGRALVRALAAEGASVAFCDINAADMAETKRLAEEEATQGARISAHKADVSNEDDLVRFRDEMMKEHQTEIIHLLFNNAGIGGGASFIRDKREVWERTFNICWGGVYLSSRVFVPMMLKAQEGHIVNTSSLNGFWASLGPGAPHNAYAAAKFAVKGRTSSAPS